MGAQHTAGPWIASPPAVAEWPDRPCVADINGGPSIYGAKGADEGDVTADARLIAAAPDLLEALEAQVRCHRLMASRLGLDDQAVLDGTAQARAAIAKAVGQ